MKRSEFDSLKKNIRSLLRDLDNGFVPNHVYDEDSKMVRTANDLCVCARFLLDSLKK